MLNKLAKLIDVKSIITILITVAFVVMAFDGRIDSQNFMTIFSVIVAFYFGTQAKKGE